MPRNLDRIEFDNLVKRMEVVFNSLEQCEDPEFNTDCEQNEFIQELNYLVKDIELFYRKD